MGQGDGCGGSGYCRVPRVLLRNALSGGGANLGHSNGRSAQVSGEMMLAIAYGVVLTASGLWIWRRVLKDYGTGRDD